MSEHCIYKIQNKLNGKTYIGQTNDLNRRIYEHKHYGKYAIGNAIKKYGWENFNISILKNNLTLKEANKWEVYLINEIYNTYKGSRGYNLQVGGKAHHNIKEFKCEYCGKKYKAQVTGSNKYCSINCYSAHRREKRIDFEERECVICGEKFETRKDTPSKTCSSSCASKLGYLNNKESYKAGRRGRIKLSLEECYEIYKRYRINKEDITYNDLADEYNVHRDTISSILNLKHWTSNKIKERW